VLENWATFDGYAVGHNLGDLRELPRWMLTKDAGSEADLRKFEARLWMPPTGEVPAAGSPWSAEGETAAFAAFTRAQPGASIGAGEP
jgi:hypothetical protein